MGIDTKIPSLSPIFPLQFVKTALFQFDHRDPGLALAVASEAEALDLSAALENLVDGGAERARPLAVDDRHRPQL